MYVGDEGYVLAGFNGDNPRVYPESKKIGDPQATRRGLAHGPGHRPVVRRHEGRAGLGHQFELMSPVTEAFLLGCLAQRLRVNGSMGQREHAVHQFRESQSMGDPAYRSEVQDEPQMDTDEHSAA